MSKENLSNEAQNPPLRKAAVSGSVIRKTKFDWKYRYVEDGQIEPDEHGRWAIDCYMFIHIDKALPKYKWCKGLFKSDKQYLPVRVATMFQKEAVNGAVPSIVNKYCVCMPTFEDAGNIGMSTQRYFYSNDIEELKAIVEEQFEHIRTVFKHCR
jgi:hypothetical protein